jgi:hypothetical protein
VNTRARWTIGILVALVIGLVVGLIIVAGDNSKNASDTISIQSISTPTRAATTTTPQTTTQSTTTTTPNGGTGVPRGTTSPSGSGGL